MCNSKSWLHCNDVTVLRGDENKVNNTSSYIRYHIFRITTSFFPHIVRGLRFLVFRCGDCTCNFNPCAFYLIRGPGYLSLSSGVTTLHITQ